MLGINQRRHQQKSEAGVSVASKMDMCPPTICFVLFWPKPTKNASHSPFELTSQTTSYRDSITEAAYIDSYKT